jgi:hypothetical protein
LKHDFESNAENYYLRLAQIFDASLLVRKQIMKRHMQNISLNFIKEDFKINLASETPFINTFMPVSRKQIPK